MAEISAVGANTDKMNVAAKSGTELKNKKSITKSKDSKQKNTMQDIIKKKIESDKKKSPAESQTGKKINILT